MYWNEKTIESLDLKEIHDSIKKINSYNVNGKINLLKKLISVIKLVN